ncbi:MAG TPA: hypothetical protein VJN44_01590, partial [Roseateles sp.]|nr:hypothetical protein [Roseateles sp.]
MNMAIKMTFKALSDPGLERPLAMARPLAALVEQLRSLALLLARLYVAQVFLLAGLSKIRDWD